MPQTCTDCPAYANTRQLNRLDRKISSSESTQKQSATSASHTTSHVTHGCFYLNACCAQQRWRSSGQWTGRSGYSLHRNAPHDVTANLDSFICRIKDYYLRVEPITKPRTPGNTRCVKAESGADFTVNRRVCVWVWAWIRWIPRTLRQCHNLMLQWRVARARWVILHPPNQRR